jgi:hypothetical protein
MRRSVDLRKLIDRHLTVMMARLGFVREKRGMYRSSLGTDVVGIATFPEKLWAGVKWECFPNVGVRHDGVNRLLCELSNLSKSDRSLGLLRANLITNIGYLTPARSHRAWSFPFNTDPEPAARDMIATIETYGLPFIRILFAGRTFREVLASGRYSLASQDRDLPALYFVEGDYGAAENYLRASLEKRTNRHDPEAEQYRMFAARLHELILAHKEGTRGPEL